jgi:hypothetical protein
MRLSSGGEGYSKYPDVTGATLVMKCPTESGAGVVVQGRLQNVVV